MITVYWRPKDHIEEGKLDALKSKKPVWVDCLNPTRTELEKISELTKIPITEFKEHLQSYERPTTIEDDNYSLIVFGAPVTRKEGAEVSSLAIFLCKNQNIITLRTEAIEGMEKFRQAMVEKNARYLETPVLALQMMLESIIDNYFDHIELFQETADKIEAVVFENPQKKSIQKTFKIRKSLLFFQKALNANREVLVAIEKQYLSRIDKKKLPEFKEIRDDIVQLLDTGDTLRSILTGVLDIYTSAMANQMNQVIKKLTVVASYVLIPTLIASIYGMNFKFMPEIPWLWGYPFALALMGVSIMLVYLYFRKSKLI